MDENGKQVGVVEDAVLGADRKLRGMAYAKAIGADVAAAILYRADFSARELMLIYPDFAGEAAGDAVARADVKARLEGLDLHYEGLTGAAAWWA